MFYGPSWAFCSVIWFKKKHFLFINLIIKRKFYQETLGSVCSTLVCKNSTSNSFTTFVAGAAEGTTCASGQVS
jgi:hypothetical protein